MSLPHIILGMLRKEPKSGYDLKKELETVIHFFWEADISRIYR
ncbi:MAG TPA: PadR family transcriptional regulator, partial [Anaerolineae bacterium]|nr:PadR family transcriptional regulator [Anaerolineae bacterium]